MNKNLYDPQEEALERNIAVEFINFKKINSLLSRSVIYLRDSMNRIEKRCSLTYELVHHSRNHTEPHGFCPGHSKEEEEIIKQEAANKLISKSRLYELLESCYGIDRIAEELEVTKEVLDDYFRYCKSRKMSELSVI